MGISSTDPKLRERLLGRYFTAAYRPGGVTLTIGRKTIPAENLLRLRPMPKATTVFVAHLASWSHWHPPLHFCDMHTFL